MEKLDWTLDWIGLESGLDWTGLDLTGLFLEGVTFLGGRSGCSIFSNLLNDRVFNLSPKGYIFSFGGGGGGERGVALYRLYFVGFVLSVIFSLGGGLRLVALFDSQPSRFT